MKTSWVYYAMLALIAEKVIQHTVVTLAFYFNWQDIVATVVVNPRILMVSGAIVGVLFIVSLWGMLRRKAWALNLTLALALFDFVGEFIAQGKLAIVITVSFVVALTLLVLGGIYRQRRA